jgi:hypothetical protein
MNHAECCDPSKECPKPAAPTCEDKSPVMEKASKVEVDPAFTFLAAVTVDSPEISWTGVAASAHYSPPDIPLVNSALLL